MRTLSIDIETYSDVPLQKSGVYRYAESSSFEILLFGYSVDSGPVQVVDLACGEQIPTEVLEALTDDSVIKWAFNAAFERVCLSRYLRDLGVSLDPFHDHHPLSGGSPVSESGKLALLHDLGSDNGPPLILGRRRRCTRTGKAEANRGKRSDQILLSAVCANKGKRPANAEPAISRSG